MKNYGVLCWESLHAPRFALIPASARVQPPKDDTNEIQLRITDVETYYNNALENNLFTSLIPVQMSVEWEICEITGYPHTEITILCVPCSFRVPSLWAVIPGTDISHFYVISQDQDSESIYGRFEGLIEETVTVADEQINFSQEAIEYSFLQSQYAHGKQHTLFNQRETKVKNKL